MLLFKMRQGRFSKSDGGVLGKRLNAVRVTAVFLLFTAAAPACDEDDSRKVFIVRSSAFGEKETMPNAYACGSGVSPPIFFSQVPEEVKSLVLILEDPERISGTYTHWMIWGLARMVILPQDIESTPVKGAVMGTADDKSTVGYLAPCPPDNETHNVVFRALGLDKDLDLEEGASRAQLDKAVKGHIIAEAELTAKAVGR
jgi:Raf kinase inhibitor-like YbhB/YbcL family protein